MRGEAAELARVGGGVSDVVALAADAAPAVRAASREVRAGWLRAIAKAVDAAADALVEIADRETHLGAERLRGEVARTTGQLRLFADVVEEGSYLEAIVDAADPAAVPPRPELRRLLRPLGTVAVFSASNFPFAFSVAGGDTAAALAAGCPVVVKGHSGHPALSRATARIVTDALAAAGAPTGAFGLVEGRQAGLDLVRAPEVRAAAFTGSLAGAQGLMDEIARRPDPIPFFGELGSTNPVVVTPGAIAARGDAILDGLVASFTLGGGQFCTKPGLVFVPRGVADDRRLNERVAERPAFTLLTDRITEAFAPGVARLRDDGAARVVAGHASEASGPVRAVVVATDIGTFLERSDVLLEECFGPVTVLVEYDSVAEVPAALSRVAGSLTGTLHAQPDEAIDDIVAALEERVGRIVFDGWPTGVAVTWSQHHGGPWPATTSAFTSVGATSIRRFLRPVAYQQAPAAALPADLRDEALAGIPHRRDGELVLPSKTEGTS
jgi:NADP-dependent aldehyde dehydrogenase